jgi:hypothetical protein
VTIHLENTLSRVNGNVNSSTYLPTTLHALARPPGLPVPLCIDGTQALLLVLATKHGIDSTLTQGADIRRLEPKVLRSKLVLLGQGAAEDAHVVCLVTQCQYICPW